MTTTHSFHLEIKAVSGRNFEGHGSVFGNVDRGGDIVLPGAFAKSLAQHKSDGTMPLMFWMHDPSQVPGVWTDMKEDADGLWVKGEVLDTTLGRDVRELLSKKAVRGLSIGYVPGDVGWDRDGNRLLKQVELHEVSVVSMAMNPLARIEAVKARLSRDGEYVPTPRELEAHLREIGCSKSVSRALVSRLLDTSSGAMPEPRCDAGEVEDEEAAKGLNEALALLTKDAEAAQARAALTRLSIR